MSARYLPADTRPATHAVTTRDLRPGMRLLMPPPHVPYPVRVVRTVRGVTESGYVNHRDEPLIAVRFAEPPDADWGDGNTGLWDDTWPVLDGNTPSAVPRGGARHDRHDTGHTG